jgi:VanZ family protein
MKSRTSSRWIAVGGLALFAAIAADTLAPVAWQVRLGLHWLIEHFLAYFALTIILCLAWPKPMAVAAVLIPLAVLLEATQALTPDRVPDAATALIDATAVAAAALLADRVIAWRKMAGAGRAAGAKT